MFDNYFLSLYKDILACGMLRGSTHSVRFKNEHDLEEAIVDAYNIERHKWLSYISSKFKAKEFEYFRSGMLHGYYDVNRLGAYRSSKEYARNRQMIIDQGDCFENADMISWRNHPVYAIISLSVTYLTNYRLAISEPPTYQHKAATDWYVSDYEWCRQNCVYDWIIYRGFIWFENEGDRALFLIAKKYD